MERPDLLRRRTPFNVQTVLFMPSVGGFGLSRAWCMRRVADALPRDDARVLALRAAAQRHAEASLGAVVGSDYTVEHWLAAYAVLLLS